ncbi:MAG: M81 family metallopeptidase [Ectothiorhodospiraceae bacterium]|nr:M81 family metallopeptidase [Ectothiorhodospiraceae bacterium]
MKIFTAGVLTETNTFSPIPTGLGAYEGEYLMRGDVNPDDRHGYEVPVNVWKRMAAERGWTLVQGLHAASQPSAATVRRVWESFRDEILDGLARAMPVDMVLLRLHGAMVADGYDDCEGDLLERARALVGPDVPIGAELDPHGHLTARMVENATALVIYKEYPHTDFAERARELFDIIADTALGKVRPHMAVHDCRMIEMFFTTLEPMRGFVARMKSLEGHDRVLSISANHGFPWADVPELGTKMLVVTDDAPEVGAELAARLGRELVAMRGKTRVAALPIEEALAAAAAAPPGPVVLADVADNAGGGAPSDSTSVLRALVERGVRDATIGMIWDPGAVALAHEAGVGARLRMRIGGKVDPLGPGPIDLDVEVTGLARDQRVAYAGVRIGVGDMAALECDGIAIVLNSRRTQTRSLDCFTAVGIDPRARRLVVVKSFNHFRAAFDPIAAATLYVAAPGTLDPDFTRIPYRRIPRPIWPLDPDPWS